jgi:hypothetical protein
VGVRETPCCCSSKTAGADQVGLLDSLNGCLACAGGDPDPEI